ncbi:hypothetical protein [Bacillus cereus]|uniref:hypothetical protein n=1 Tax=Bacillus cereus TaxID=1396 RepID=UPI001F0B128F|nr:hypothetical protein [Bacillus cereus]MEC3021275.1 hypothetical protein [Bacillus cereus]MEC3260721.1 hypothetical protein [Bacillus cereus]
MKTIEIEIIRSGSRQDLKKESDKVVKKFRSKDLEVVGQWFKGLGYSLIGLSCIGLLVGLPTVGEGAGAPFYW